MSGLQSKVIVVTGGTAGMGVAFSRRAASDAPTPGAGANTRIGWDPVHDFQGRNHLPSQYQAVQPGGGTPMWTESAMWRRPDADSATPRAFGIDRQNLR